MLSRDFTPLPFHISPFTSPVVFRSLVFLTAFLPLALLACRGRSALLARTGRMPGFDFPENFLHPHAATSVRDFWRRWLVSLSTWFRDYLSIPLGGNRRHHPSRRAAKKR